MKFLYKSISVSIVSSLPLFAFAQGINFTLVSPLQNIGTIQDLLLALLRIFITIATPIVVLAIVYAGFQYVTAQGNAEQVKKATRALMYALIGGVLIIGAVAISTIITNVVAQF